MSPLTGEHPPRMRAPGRQSAWPSLTQRRQTLAIQGSLIAYVRIQSIRAVADKDQGRATTRSSSLAHLIKREASCCRQSARRGGASVQPPQNESMEHQGQRNREGWHHDQRIGRDEEGRRIEGQEGGLSRGRHCPPGGWHDKVGGSEKGPGVCFPVR